MDRRGFLKTLIGGVAATAAVRTFPFRVYSFPNQIEVLSVQEMSDRYIVPAVQNYVAVSLNGRLAVTRENKIVIPTAEELKRHGIIRNPTHPAMRSPSTVYRGYSENAEIEFNPRVRQPSLLP